jgi:hypothetical protein
VKLETLSVIHLVRLALKLGSEIEKNNVKKQSRQALKDTDSGRTKRTSVRTRKQKQKTEEETKFCMHD